jgi:AbiV family abortive infection protein
MGASGMDNESAKFQRSITACIENGKRLLEEAEWSYHQASTGLVLALLAQEEAAKAFVLTLVRDGILPWSADVHHSLSVHEGKHLVSVIMEWLFAVNEQRFNEGLKILSSTAAPASVPPDVATAMNIFRHEMIERIGRRHPDRYDDWDGPARKLADGKLDRKKQFALYVRIGRDGSLASKPPTSPEAYNEEMVRARNLIEFAGDADRKCIFAFREYELFTELFRAMFDDLRPGAIVREERFESPIPGVEFVKRTITVANIVREGEAVSVDE